MHKKLMCGILKFVLDNQNIWWYYSINKRDNNQHKGEIDMMVALIIIEVVAILNMMVVLKKNRTVAEHLFPVIILVVANYIAWTL